MSNRTNMMGGALCMLAISTALVLLPGVGGLIGGIVGGYKAGSWGRALLVALAPALALGVLFWAAWASFSPEVTIALLPGIGAVGGAALSAAAMLAGAGLGGALAGASPSARRPAGASSLH